MRDILFFSCLLLYLLTLGYIELYLKPDYVEVKVNGMAICHLNDIDSPPATDSVVIEFDSFKRKHNEITFHNKESGPVRLYAPCVMNFDRE